MGVATLLGESVLKARGALLVGPTLQDAVLDQLGETRRQEMGREAERGLEVVEAASAQEAITQDQQGPAIANHREGPSDGAVELPDFLPAHGEMLLQKLKLFNGGIVGPR